MSDMHVSAAARQEAAAVYRCPITFTADGFAMLEGHGAIATKEWAEIAAALKPETFGLLGRIVERTVEPIVAGVEEAIPTGSLGLFVYPTEEGQGLREATPKDVRTWNDLAKLWEVNMVANIGPAIATHEDQDEITTLRALVAFRVLGVLGLERLMAHGVNTGVGGCAVMQWGIENHLIEVAEKHGDGLDVDLADGDLRTTIIMRSHGPYVEAASLNPAQLKAFGEAYANPMMSGGSHVTAPDGTERDMFELGRQAKVNLSGPIEQLPTKDGSGVIGDVEAPLPGERIGCPILLSPKLAQRMWVAFAHTARFSGLLGANLAERPLELVAS
jgi:hypothetical protein